MKPLKFKGNRNYLHGTDLFDALQGLRDPNENALGSSVKMLKIRRFSQCQPIVHFDKPESGVLVADGSFFGSFQERKFWITESSESIVDRYDYNEELIETNTIISFVKKAAIIETDMENYSIIELIVSETKQLNYKLMPNIDGKWVFGQIKLDRPLPSQHHSLRVEMGSRIENRFSDNQIEIDGQMIGKIRFIVGKP